MKRNVLAAALAILMMLMTSCSGKTSEAVPAVTTEMTETALTAAPQSATAAPSEPAADSAPDASFSPSEEFLAVVKSALGVPDDQEIRYEYGDVTYWEAGTAYYVDISFYKGDELIACASVDPATASPLKNIMAYSGA